MIAVMMEPGQLHEAGADQVPDAFGVGHDPRDQDAALGRVEVADRQAHHVRLDVLAHVGDRALRGDAENLRVRERAERVDDRRHADRHCELRQQVPVFLGDDIIHQVLCRPGKDEAGQAVDQHQREPEREPLAMDPDQAARFFPRASGERFLLGRLGRVGGYRRPACLFRMSHAFMIRRVQPPPLGCGGPPKHREGGKDPAYTNGEESVPRAAGGGRRDVPLQLHVGDALPYLRCRQSRMAVARPPASLVPVTR